MTASLRPPQGLGFQGVVNYVADDKNGALYSKGIALIMRGSFCRRLIRILFVYARMWPLDTTLGARTKTRLTMRAIHLYG